MKRIRFKKKDGDIVIGKERLSKAFRNLDDGDYACELKTWTGAKTWEQIKLVKGILIPKLSEFTGESKKEVERRLKEDYGVTERFTDSNGNPCIEFTSFRYYSKKQMMDFIDGSLKHAEEDLGFIIDPDLKKQFYFDEQTGELEEFGQQDIFN